MLEEADICRKISGVHMANEKKWNVNSRTQRKSRDTRFNGGLFAWVMKSFSNYPGGIYFKSGNWPWDMKCLLYDFLIQ